MILLNSKGTRQNFKNGAKQVKFLFKKINNIDVAIGLIYYNYLEFVKSI